MCLYSYSTQARNFIRRGSHHITGSVINCGREGQLESAESSDQCCYMYPGICSSAVGPVAQWQEHLGSIRKVPGLNPSWIPVEFFLLQPASTVNFLPTNIELCWQWIVPIWLYSTWTWLNGCGLHVLTCAASGQPHANIMRHSVHCVKCFGCCSLKLATNKAELFCPLNHY